MTRTPAPTRHTKPTDLRAPDYFAEMETMPTTLASALAPEQISSARRVIAAHAESESERVEFERMVLGVAL